jgi:L-fuconolactonase
MDVVDSHCHVSPVWYEPVESLLFQMDRHGVAHAILNQMFGQADNTYQADVVRRYPGRFASVVLVDPDQPDATAALERLVAEGASGLRLRPTARSRGRDPLQIWRDAERLGITVTVGGVGGPEGRGELFATDEFRDVVRSLPKLRIVIEHLGSLTNQNDEVQRRVFALAKYPNVYIKFHGLGEFCKRAMPVLGSFPFAEPIPPLLDLAYEAFGPSRMMWGSDHPPVSRLEGYGNALRLPMERLAPTGEKVLRAIFAENALALFPIRS